MTGFGSNPQAPANSRNSPRMKIGMSLLCEQPDRKTGLSSLFTAFVRESLRLYDDVKFVIFHAEGQSLGVEDPRIEFREAMPPTTV